MTLLGVSLGFCLSMPAILGHTLLATDCNPDLPGVFSGLNQLSWGEISKLGDPSVIHDYLRKARAKLIFQKKLELTEFHYLMARFASVTNASGTVSGM
jgi:hypothetical protein